MLYLVATPIGHFDEISILALEVLKKTENLIVESTKDSSRLLKHHGLSGKKYHTLNEYTPSEDLPALVQLCEGADVALLTDAGTPGFCDPGSELVRRCRQKNIPIRSLLGPSSLMGILSLSGVYLREFLFRGFLPAENEARQQALKELSLEKRPIILMDTPYRLKKTITDLTVYFPNRKTLLTLNLSQPNEAHIEGRPIDLQNKLQKDQIEKAEFMILIYGLIE